MTDILSEIVGRKREVVARLRADSAAQDFRDRALAIQATATPHLLLRALESNSGGVNIIAEFKRRSPSAGTIRNDLSATDVATRYERGGACAISVLTDEQYFGGSILDLGAIRASTALPLLRKDFIIDEIQIYEARRAVSTRARIIGVNNRDLRTFRTSLETSERLIAEAPQDQIMISESGLQDPKSLRHLRALGFRGFLIGEALIRARDPEVALRDFIAAAERDNANDHPHQ